MIAIIDYGMGNLYNVKNALDVLGVDSIITSKKEDLQKADKLILPGVGAMQDCMLNLEKSGLKEMIIDFVLHQKKPLLGICLGMQALFESSEENGHTKGFGFIKGNVIKMEDANVRIPHIGWNDLQFVKDMPLKDKFSKAPFVYYVHSYYASDYDKEDLVAYSEYGNMKICGVIMHGHVMGCQFHPEKSAEDGLKILKYFVEEFV